MGLKKDTRYPKWDGIILIILITGIFLLFFRLDHRPFWQDEAETACLARNVIKYGVPKAFDGVNLISQEEGKEFDADYLWRWSPWLQIYVTAAAFQVFGATTAAGRFPYAFFGAACILLVYLLVQRLSQDPAWARMSAALLAFSVPFLLFSRQCRYYSLGALLALTSVYALQKEDAAPRGAASLLVISLGLLFYANYVLFLSFIVPLFLAVALFYPEKLSLKRCFLLSCGLAVVILPGTLLFRLKQQTGMIDFIRIIEYLEKYFADLFQFLLPLPLVLYLLWRGRLLLNNRSNLPAGERFILFLFLIILGSILILSLVPQCEHRYLVHLYPFGAIILGFLVVRAWRYHRPSGALLALLLLFTNWPYLIPMDWLRLANRPNPDVHRLTYPNIPLGLYLQELSQNHPDLNQTVCQFFRRRARVGDTIITNYGDLPLQFYTSCRVVGGLQGRLGPDLSPDWAVRHSSTMWNREHELHQAEIFLKDKVLSSRNYQAVLVTHESGIHGNIPDPYHHHFLLETGPLGPLTIYQKIAAHRP